MMESSTHAQIRQVKNIFVNYPQCQAIIDEIEQCRLLSPLGNEPDCLLVTGDAGSGKTTIIEHYCRAFTPVEEPERTVIPVVATIIPSPTTPKQVAQQLLNELGDPLAGRGNIGELGFRLTQLLINCRVQLIILDEFQHLIETDSEHVLSKVANWIKTLINLTKIPVILFGMPWSDYVLETDRQLNRRYSTHRHLKPFQISTDFNYYRQFLHSVEQALPLKCDPHLADYEIAFRLFAASNGNIGKLMKLLRHTAITSIQRKQHTLTGESLCSGFNAINNVDQLNPFTGPINKLKANELKKESFWDRSPGKRGRRLHGTQYQTIGLADVFHATK